MAQPDWAPKRTKGESDSSYKTRYYRAQRQADESKAKAGDAGAGEELMKIGRKAASGGKVAIGKKDQQIGARARLGMGQAESQGRIEGAKPGTLKSRIAGVVPGLALGGLGEAAEGMGSALSGAAKGIAGKMFPAAKGMARQGERSASKAMPAARRAIESKKSLPASRKALPAPQKQLALPKPKGESPKMQHVKVKAGSARSQQATARNKGTNPRAVKKQTSGAWSGSDTARVNRMAKKYGGPEGGAKIKANVEAQAKSAANRKEKRAARYQADKAKKKAA